MASFQAGATYADYKADTDHLAEYGIAGLIAGASPQGWLLQGVAGRPGGLWKPVATGVVLVIGGIAAARLSSVVARA